MTKFSNILYKAESEIISLNFIDMNKIKIDDIFQILIDYSRPYKNYSFSVGTYILLHSNIDIMKVLIKLATRGYHFVKDKRDNHHIKQTMDDGDIEFYEFDRTVHEIILYCIRNELIDMAELLILNYNKLDYSPHRFENLKNHIVKLHNNRLINSLIDISLKDYVPDPLNLLFDLMAQDYDIIYVDRLKDNIDIDIIREYYPESYEKNAYLLEIDNPE